MKEERQVGGGGVMGERMRGRMRKKRKEVTSVLIVNA